MISEEMRHKLHTIIYEADTKKGRLFDIVLMSLILLSVFIIMLETIESINLVLGPELKAIEWFLTICFTLEYIARIISIRKPLKYIFSWWGIIDFVALAPSFVGVFFPGFNVLTSFRALRLIRVFRIMRMGKFVGASNQLVMALRAARLRIIVFIFFVLILCLILGTLMYLIEGPSNGFTSIPMSIYWTVVTLTTVGFGDITPHTPLGQIITSIISILGYGIIAVPTGLITAQMINKNTHTNTQICPNCAADFHRDDAKYCYKCSSKLNPD